jgi:hypothetical protein
MFSKACSGSRQSQFLMKIAADFGVIDDNNQPVGA